MRFGDLTTSYYVVYDYTFSGSRIRSMIYKVVEIVDQVWSKLHAGADTIYQYLVAL
jgi:hypothetical protein